MTDQPKPDLAERLAERLAGLDRDLGGLTWAEPGDVRSRGEARRQRASVAAALAVLVIVGGASAATWQVLRPAAVDIPLSGPPTVTAGETPSPSVSEPTSSPVEWTAPTTTVDDLPPEWLIQPDDLGPEWRTQVSNGDALFTITERLASCGLAQPSMALVRASARTSLTTVPSGDGIPQRDGVRIVNETLLVFAPIGAAAFVGDWRTAVAQCPQVAPGPDSTTYTSIVEEGFAGDESIMIEFKVRSTGGSGYTDYIALVRRGDRVAAVGGYQVGQSVDAAFSRSLAQTAAARMCGAAGC